MNSSIDEVAEALGELGQRQRRTKSAEQQPCFVGLMMWRP